MAEPTLIFSRATALHLDGHSQLGQALTNPRSNIEVELTGCIRGPHGNSSNAGCAGVQHLPRSRLINPIARTADRRPLDRLEILATCARDVGYQSANDICRESAPTTVRHAYDMRSINACSGYTDYRTVGSQGQDSQARGIRQESIDVAVRSSSANPRGRRPVDSSDYGQTPVRAELLSQRGAVGRHRSGRISHVIGKIPPGVLPGTPPTLARRYCKTHAVVEGSIEHP